MTYVGDFERGFVKRTLEIVKSYDGKYDATLRINCLLGLLVVPCATSLKAIPMSPATELPRWGISLECIEDYGTGPDAETIQGVVRSLRNAVAHFGFAPHPASGEVTAFDFEDKDRSGFSARIPISELHVFLERLLEHLYSS